MGTLTTPNDDGMGESDADDAGELSLSDNDGRFNAIKQFLFPAPAERSTTAIIGWWEKRRLPYNLIVGGAGLVTVGVTMLEWLYRTALGWPNVGHPPWLLAPLAVGIAANVLYCMGPALELLINKLFGRTILPVGPSLFRMGLTFSVGLMLFPGLILGVVLVITTILRIFGVIVGPF